MRLLLDSHALLWWLNGDPQLSERARQAIADDAAEVFVSAASAWELGMKMRLHRLPQAARMSATLLEACLAQGFEPLAVSFEHAERAGRLPGRHRDPFDRILAAQALCEDLQLVTLDEKIAPLGAKVLW